MTQTWLRCTVHAGMFSDELTVIIRAHDGESISAFVPKERVDRKEATTGRVKVSVFESTGMKFAVLPNEAQTIIGIDESELVAA